MAKAKRSPSAAPAAHTIGELPAAVLERARELFTAAEKRIFDSSLGASLAKATHEQVAAASKQARSLRDKWHALTSGQQRANKRRAAARVDVAASRSREKLDLFHGAVARFERRLAELSATVTAKRTPAKVRLKTDAGQKGRGKKIVTRASRRTAARPTLPARPAKAAAPAAGIVEQTLRKVVAAANPTVPPAPAPRPAADSRKVSKKVRNAGLRAALGAQAGNQAIQFDRAKQRSAATAAKARRLAVQGLDTRRSGHAAARVKIKQAKRDQRGR
jgi:hypothetical protein